MQTGRKAELKPAGANGEYRRRREQRPTAASIVRARQPSRLPDLSHDQKTLFANETDGVRWESDEVREAVDDAREVLDVRIYYGYGGS